METDHKPLLRIFGSEKGTPAHTANRLQRWALTLLNYNFDIRYIKTTEFGNVDVLSRLIDQQVKPDKAYVIACVQLETKIAEILDENVGNLPITLEVIKAATAKDETLSKVKDLSSPDNGQETRREK